MQENNDKNNTGKKISLIILIILFLLFLLTMAGFACEYIIKKNKFPENKVETPIVDDVDNNKNNNNQKPHDDKNNHHNNNNNDNNIFFPNDEPTIPNDKPSHPEWEIEQGIDGDDIILNDETSTIFNTFDGYSEAWVSKEQPTLSLSNSKENIAYARYFIYDDDELIFSTGMIAPNKHIEWNAYETLKKKGVYTLIQNCKFYIAEYSSTGIISDFIECDMDITNPYFVIEVR